MEVIKLIITRKVLIEKFSIKDEMEGFFISYLNGCEIKKIKKYPGSIFYIKGDLIFFEQALNDDGDNINYFYVRTYIWNYIRDKYKLDSTQIVVFIKSLLRENLKSIPERFVLGKNNINRFSEESFKKLEDD